MNDTVKCPRCSGTGWVPIDEAPEPPHYIDKVLCDCPVGQAERERIQSAPRCVVCGTIRVKAPGDRCNSCCPNARQLKRLRTCVEKNVVLWDTAPRSYRRLHQMRLIDRGEDAQEKVWAVANDAGRAYLEAMDAEGAT